jgi:N-methylhydantoinase B/oxoprolinase/acetone carboxylase alpha subunit
MMRDGWTYFRTDDDELTLHAPSGGGFGNPHERDRSAVELDLNRGFISTEGAARDYGHPAPNAPESMPG